MSGAISVHHGAFGRAALYRLDRPIITHAHREAHLIFNIDGSSPCVTVSSKPIIADNTCGVAVSPWEPHDFDLLGANDSCLCLVLYIKPEWFSQSSRSAHDTVRFGSSTIDMTNRIRDSVDRLTSVLVDNTSTIHFDQCLYETTQACFEQSWSRKDINLAQFSRSANYIDYRVRRSLKLMQERFGEEVEIEWLARQSGLSRPHFFKLFKKQIGITPNLYLNTLRTEQAIDELMMTKKTVTDIGFDLGFSSQASFTRFFTSNVGIPPSDYRRNANIC